MAKFEYRFPELGEGLHEGEIIKMHIKPGDKVTDEDIIMEVQNDKAVVEVPCPVNGTVQEVFGTDGAVFRVGRRRRDRRRRRHSGASGRTGA